MITRLICVRKLSNGLPKMNGAFAEILLYIYGVRYSFFGSPYDKNGRLTNFVPELFDPAAAPLVTGAGHRVAAAGKNFCNGIIANAQNYTTGPAILIAHRSLRPGANSS